MTKIKDLPKIERPREKLIQKGPQNLKDLPPRELAYPVGSLFSFSEKMVSNLFRAKREKRFCRRQVLISSKARNKVLAKGEVLIFSAKHLL